ncbi:3-dehydroquinate dehydratase / shikimate dehydrogenase [Anaerolineae bacterium]|nr:3-dehydroquinate dehydratase / shikimate dehydrogenase [Anaerolineae bacterium]
MIIVPIVGPTLADARRQIRTSRRDADMFEFRLDLCRDPELIRAIRSSRIPVIATCRPVREGGRFDGGEGDRFERLGDALRAGAAYIDCELDAVKEFRAWCSARKLRPRLIVSRHDFKDGHADVLKVYKQLRAARADIIKFAYTATDAWQIAAARTFLQRAARDRQRAIAIAMGEAGEASRILYRVFGGWATFGAAGENEGSAPGQLTAAVLRHVFLAHKRTPRTKVFGLVGDPVRQSKGIYVHNPLYAKAGFNGIYVRFPVGDLDRFMKECGPWVSGCSVTLPHKSAMARHCTSFIGSAAMIGAVNTVVRQGRRWIGANTDAGAALDAIEKQFPVRGERMVILGAGGAARAIAVEGARRGAMVTIANRSEDRARGLSSELDVAWCRTDALAAAQPAILVNTTPVGMWPAMDAVPVPSIPPCVRLAFDAIYNPAVTRFLAMAAEQGARTVSGAAMYAGQAVDQIRILTGVRVSGATVMRTFQTAIRQHP